MSKLYKYVCQVRLKGHVLETWRCETEDELNDLICGLSMKFSSPAIILVYDGEGFADEILCE